MIGELPMLTKGPIALFYGGTSRMILFEKQNHWNIFFSFYVWLQVVRLKQASQVILLVTSSISLQIHTIVRESNLA